MYLSCKCILDAYATKLYRKSGSAQYCLAAGKTKVTRFAAEKDHRSNISRPWHGMGWLNYKSNFKALLLWWADIFIRLVPSLRWTRTHQHFSPDPSGQPLTIAFHKQLQQDHRHAIALFLCFQTKRWDKRFRDKTIFKNYYFFASYVRKIAEILAVL